jgi:hypothetical protein
MIWTPDGDMNRACEKRCGKKPTKRTVTSNSCLGYFGCVSNSFWCNSNSKLMIFEFEVRI